MMQIGLWHITAKGPNRPDRGGIDLEKHLTGSSEIPACSRPDS